MCLTVYAVYIRAFDTLCSELKNKSSQSALRASASARIVRSSPGERSARARQSIGLALSCSGRLCSGSTSLGKFVKFYVIF